MVQVTEVLDTSAAAVSNQKLKYINRTFNPESLKSLLITMDCKCWQIQYLGVKGVVLQCIF